MRTEQKLIELIFRDSSKKPALEPLWERALESYQPPSRSLICIFDNEERPEVHRFTSARQKLLWILCSVA